MRRIAAARTKDCVSDVCELYIAHVFANGDNGGILHFRPTILFQFSRDCYWWDWGSFNRGVQFASWPHPLWRMPVPSRQQHGQNMFDIFRHILSMLLPQFLK